MQRYSRFSLLVSYKRDENINNFLVSTTLKSKDQPAHLNVHVRCRTCPFISNVNKISEPKRTVIITNHLTCISPNLVYCITCNLYRKIYIGYPGRRLGDRFREQLRDVEINDKGASKAPKPLTKTHGGLRPSLYRILKTENGNLSHKMALLVPVESTTAFHSSK